MLDKYKYYALNFILMVIWRMKSLSFSRSALSVGRVQEKLLFRLLKKNKNTKYGIRHGLSAIKTVREYQTRVPLTEYDSYGQYIGMILEGRQGVLTSEEISSIAVSSGSTAASKRIPYNKALKGEFQKAISPWLSDLFRRHGKILSGSMYFSITPSMSPSEVGSAAVPVGFENDSEYFGFPERLLLKWLLCVPEEVQKIDNSLAFKYMTLLFLLKEKHLSFISIWNPTFLTILLKHAQEWNENLVYDIAHGTINPPGPIEGGLKSSIIRRFSKDKKRAAEISEIFKFHGSSSGPSGLFEKIWPGLAVISCWTDGNSANYAAELKVYFPNVYMQGKGLLATEGVVSFPLTSQTGCVLAVESHFFEFEEIDTKSWNKTCASPVLAHEVKKGKRYSVVITTGGGLYRYRLKDIIEVEGFMTECPLVKFIGKEDNISDIFGEKLNECHVAHILEPIFAGFSIAPRFYMVAPEHDNSNDSYFYALFIQTNDGIPACILRKIEIRLEEGLNENFHYSYCRKIGQLSAVKVFIIYGCDAVGVYNETLREEGRKEGNIKAFALHPRMGWSMKFKGTFMRATSGFTYKMANAKIN